MTKEEKGISMKQVIAIFVLSAAAPLVRLVPAFVAQKSGAASWLILPVLMLYGFILTIIVNKLINGFKDKNGNKIKIKNLMDVFDITYGKTIGKILCIIYILWILLCMSVQVRIFAERFVVTLLIYAPIDFFIISMLVIIYFMSNTRIEAFGRFSQITIIVFLIIIGIVAIIIVKDIDTNNLLPVTIYDTKNILISATEIAGLCCFFTYSFFFGKKILDKENINKNRKFVIFPIAFITFSSIITTIGVFGHEAVAVFTQPFFSVLRNISLFNSIERIESILVALWVTADVTLVCFLLLCVSNLCKNTFKLSSRKVAIAPLLLLLYGLVLLVGKSYIYMLNFSALVIIPTNLFFGMIFPLITVFTAKFRKLI